MKVYDLDDHFRKQGISPSRKPSQTMKKNVKEITELNAEIRALKGYNTEKTATKKLFSSKQNTDSKNVSLTSTASGGQNNTVQLLTIINFT